MEPTGPSFHLDQLQRTNPLRAFRRFIQCQSKKQLKTVPSVVLRFKTVKKFLNRLETNGRNGI